MQGHDIIVIGASAGGVEALTELARNLPADFPASVFIVLHVPAYGVSVLPAILSRAGSLPAIHPQNDQAIRPGQIYIAPPDHHLLVKPGFVRVVRGPRENSHRPAVDPLFRTAARAYGRRVVGVILSGTLDDGTAGLQSVSRHGGTTIVQDPQDALFAGMPTSAIENVSVDHIVPLSQIPALLTRLASEPVAEKDVPMSNLSDVDADGERDIVEVPVGEVQHGHPSVFACPECNGVLWEISAGDLLRFRCRVGHAFTAESLLAEQSEALDDALWSACRALEESADLSRRMAERARGRGHELSAQHFEKQAEETEVRASVIRNVVERGVLDAPREAAKADNSWDASETK